MPAWSGRLTLPASCGILLRETRFHLVELAALISHRFPIRDAEKAFTLYERHADGITKALLDATSW